MGIQQCNFGRWLAAEKVLACKVKALLLEITSRQADAHKLAESLLRMRSQEFKNEVLEQMGELHNIRDVLLEALNQLLSESQIDS